MSTTPEHGPLTDAALREEVHVLSASVRRLTEQSTQLRSIFMPREEVIEQRRTTLRTILISVTAGVIVVLTGLIIASSIYAAQQSQQESYNAALLRTCRERNEQTEAIREFFQTVRGLANTNGLSAEQLAQRNAAYDKLFEAYRPIDCATGSTS